MTDYYLMSKKGDTLHRPTASGRARCGAKATHVVRLPDEAVKSWRRASSWRRYRMSILCANCSYFVYRDEQKAKEAKK